MIALRQPVILITKIEMAFLDIPTDYADFWRADFVVDAMPVAGVLFFRTHKSVQVLIPAGSTDIALSRYVQRTIGRKFRKAVKHLERES